MESLIWKRYGVTMVRVEKIGAWIKRRNGLKRGNTYCRSDGLLAMGLEHWNKQGVVSYGHGTSD